MCGDPSCSYCFMQPEPCPLCGKLRASDCEECWVEETEEPCQGGCDCDCACAEADIQEWNRKAIEAEELDRAIGEAWEERELP